MKKTVETHVCPACGANKFSNGKCEYCGTIVDMEKVDEHLKKIEQKQEEHEKEEVLQKTQSEKTIKKWMITSWVFAGLFSLYGVGIVTSLLALIKTIKDNNNNYKYKAIIALSLNIVLLIVFLVLYDSLESTEAFIFTR